MYRGSSSWVLGVFLVLSLESKKDRIRSIPSRIASNLDLFFFLSDCFLDLFLGSLVFSLGLLLRSSASFLAYSAPFLLLENSLEKNPSFWVFWAIFSVALIPFPAFPANPTPPTRISE